MHVSLQARLYVHSRALNWSLAHQYTPVHPCHVESFLTDHKYLTAYIRYIQQSQVMITTYLNFEFMLFWFGMDVMIVTITQKVQFEGMD